MNLIPEERPDTHNYWCSWHLQNTTKFAKMPIVTALDARNALNETFLFGAQGALNHIDPKIRTELYVMLDDGWDVPLNTKKESAFGSLELNVDRFPSFQGSPEKRLKDLHDKITAMGFKGTGLWVAANPVGEKRFLPFSHQRMKAYYTERLLWSKHAGIAYWKVDWGIHCNSVWFRRFLSELAHDIYPELIIEHAVIKPPFAGSTTVLGRLMDAYRYHKTRRFLAYSDRFRTYDVVRELSIPTTLKRIADIFEMHIPDTHGYQAILNIEDEPYIGASLGCSIGIMRHLDCDPAKQQDNKHLNLRQTELLRALRFQRLMPPFGIHRTKNIMDEEVLRDAWHFSDPALAWAGVIGKTKAQYAPSRLSRNMGLPEVTVDGPKPYVTASKSPDASVYAIATHSRIIQQNAFSTPRADITIHIQNENACIGIFGHYGTLTLKFPDRTRPKHVFAQDLAKDDAEDIMQRIQWQGNALIMDGSVIDALCRDPSASDPSEPGIVIQLSQT